MGPRRRSGRSPERPITPPATAPTPGVSSTATWPPYSTPRRRRSRRERLKGYQNSMEFSFKVEGLDRIDQATARVRQAVADEINRAVYASAQKVAADYKKSILSGNKSGRVYKRRTVEHRASAPG